LLGSILNSPRISQDPPGPELHPRYAAVRGPKWPEAIGKAD